MSSVAKPKEKRWASLLLLSASIGLSLGLAEAVARRYTDSFAMAEESRFIAYDPDLGWTNRPGLQSIFTSAKKNYHGRVSFDSLGLRENDSSRLERPRLNILLLGDSTTLGMEVNNDETYAALLEQRLRGNGVRANVWNAGVRGYGTDQSYLRLLALRKELRPDLVIYMSCGNDFSDNLSIKSWQRPYSKPAYLLDHDTLTLANQPAASFKRGQYAVVQYGQGDTYSIDYGALKSSGLAAWLRDRSALYDLLETSYYIYFSRTVFNVVKRNPEAERKILAGIVRKMRTAAPLFYVTSFTKEKGGDGVGYDEVQEITRREQVPFLDIRPYFQAGNRYDWKVDSHWNQTGHRQAAEALFAELMARPDFLRLAGKGGKLGKR